MTSKETDRPMRSTRRTDDEHVWKNLGTAFVNMIAASLPMTDAPRFHAYLHSTNEELTLIASGSTEFVALSMARYLYHHEPHSEDRVVISEVKVSMDAGDWMMANARAVL